MIRDKQEKYISAKQLFIRVFTAMFTVKNRKSPIFNRNIREKLKKTGQIEIIYYNKHR